MAIILLASGAVLGSLYGIHLAYSAGAAMMAIHPSLALLYSVVLAVVIFALVAVLWRTAAQYQLLASVAELQFLAHSAHSRRPGPADEGRQAIESYLDRLRNGCDPFTRESINRLRTKFGQYSGDLSRDFKLLEEHVLRNLDRKVEARIGSRAIQAGVATVVAPRLLDPLIVCGQGIQMVRETAAVYGGRPGLLGTAQLLARAASAAIFAGVVNLLADALDQLSGKRVISKLGARAGEELTNAFLIVRLGEATKRLCRPVPLPPANFKSSLGTLLEALLKQWAPDDDQRVTGRQAAAAVPSP